MADANVKSALSNVLQCTISHAPFKRKAAQCDLGRTKDVPARHEQSVPSRFAGAAIIRCDLGRTKAVPVRYVQPIRARFGEAGAALGVSIPYLLRNEECDAAAYAHRKKEENNFFRGPGGAHPQTG